MSKRFGRNQKRQLKQELADMESAVCLLYQRNQELESLMERNRQIVRDTAEILGREFVSMPVQYREVNRVLDEAIPRWRWRPSQERPFSQLVDFDYDAQYLEHALPLLRSLGVHQDIQRMVHFRIAFDERVYAYAVSEDALRKMPTRRAVQLIAEEIAGLLVADLTQEDAA